MSLKEYLIFQPVFREKGTFLFAESSSRRASGSLIMLPCTDRTTILEWLSNFQREFRLEISSLHTAMNLFDRYMTARDSIPRNEWQLLGAACMWTAAKYTETPVNTPGLSVITALCCDLYDERQVMKMESKVLETVQWDLSSIPAYSITADLTKLLDLSDTETENAVVVAHYTLRFAIFVGVPPFYVALACILAGIMGFEYQGPQVSFLQRRRTETVLNRLIEYKLVDLRMWDKIIDLSQSAVTVAKSVSEDDMAWVREFLM